MKSTAATEFVKKVALWLPVGVLLGDFTIGVAQVSGRSMQPTLNPSDSNSTDDYVLLDKFSHKVRSKPLCRNDIVVIKEPGASSYIIKRIIGLENDWIKERDDSRMITAVSKGCVWVEGDAGTGQSQDSNDFGPISESLIEARVTGVVWPPHRAGRIDNTAFKFPSDRVNAF